MEEMIQSWKTLLKYALIIIGICFIVMIFFEFVGIPEFALNYVASVSQECGYTASSVYGSIFKSCECSGFLFSKNQYRGIFMREIGGSSTLYCFLGTCGNCECISSSTGENISCYLDGLYLMNETHGDLQQKVAIPPAKKRLEVEKGKEEHFQIVINNVDNGTESSKFSYKTKIETLRQDTSDKCKADSDYFINLISNNNSTSEIILAPKEIGAFEVIAHADKETPPCVVRYRFTVEKDGKSYGSDTIYITFK